ncbi:hypothetical protein FSP39_022648 [Pinctada imbricata]|uniref:Vwde helical domain-containing protein n=1 Tax=Pinctada imbricata TaxID=66713 RepID=A0AA89C802_PINIB|nr:hypothetical protein FSP39_022648 [Pinctada imbricata]
MGAFETTYVSNIGCLTGYEQNWRRRIAPDQEPTNVVATYSDIKWKDKGDFSFPYLVYSCTFDKVPNTNYCYNVFWLIGNKVVYEQGVKENITKGESKAEDFHFHEDDYHLGITTDQTGLALTEKEAMAKCSELLLSSKMYNVCTEVVKELGNSFAEDCKLDLMYTGDYTFAKMALEGALGSCKYSVVRNTALQEDLPELTTEIFTQICPNNCSGNGICENGSCSCEQSFGGADCSYSLVMPPEVLSVHGDGICDRSQENCRSVVFYGDNFLQNGNTTCNVSVFQFIADGSLLATMNNAITSGEQYSIFQASCDIDDSDKIFATLAKVSISNDGYIFTQEYEVINFDSTCQIYDSTSKQVMLQSGFCYIDGGCYHNMEKNPSKRCQACQSAKSVDSWSYDTTFCFISDNCYSDLDPNPSDNCEVCSISKSTSTWSISDTTCVINGSCHLNGDPNPDNRCEVCSIKSRGRYEWSQSNSTCVIDGQCFIDGEAAPKAQCRVCDFKRNASEWTLQSSFCFIDGKCVRNGRSNLADPCFTCNVDKSQYEWSTKNQYCYSEGGCYLPGDVDPAEPCNMCIDVNGMIKWALNPDFCKINDYCYRNGTINPQQSCYECNSSVNQTSWSQSELFCIINGECFSDGANNTEKECLFCNVTQRKTEWSLRSEDICYIDGECFSNKEENPMNECLECNLQKAGQFKWSTKDNLCHYEEKCYEVGEVHPLYQCKICSSFSNYSDWIVKQDYCFIDYSCHKNKYDNSSNKCFECNLQKAGRFEWSTKDNLCYLDNDCFTIGDDHPSYECKACASFNNASDWTVKSEYCFINNLCLRNGSNHASLSCLECDASNNSTEWTVVIGFCFINGKCHANGDFHPLDKDLICDSMPGFKMTWSNKHDEEVQDIDDDSVDTRMILSIVVPVIIVIIIIVVVIFIYRRRSKSGSLSTEERNKELGSLRNPTYETGDVTNIDSQLLQPDNSDPDPQD